MAYYLGLDVSQKQTALCLVDDKGTIVAEGKALTDPGDIQSWIKTKGLALESIVRAGLEAGAMSSWLCTELVKSGLPVICMESFQAYQFLKTQRNKTDKNDARGLAQLVRMGETFIKEIVIRSQGRQELRTLLTLRQQLVILTAGRAHGQAQRKQDHLANDYRRCRERSDYLRADRCGISSALTIRHRKDYSDLSDRFRIRRLIDASIASGLMSGSLRTAVTAIT